jgi:hypothetical protein
MPFSHSPHGLWLVIRGLNGPQNPLGELMHKSPPVIFPDFEATFPCSKIPGGKSAGMFLTPQKNMGAKTRSTAARARPRRKMQCDDLIVIVHGGEGVGLQPQHSRPP